MRNWGNAVNVEQVVVLAALAVIIIFVIWIVRHNRAPDGTRADVARTPSEVVAPRPLTPQARGTTQLPAPLCSSPQRRKRRSRESYANFMLRYWWIPPAPLSVQKTGPPGSGHGDLV